MAERLSSIEDASSGKALGAALRQFIRNGANVVLARLESARAEELPSICESALQILHYCALAREGWPQCRQIIPGVAPGMEQFGDRDTWLFTLESCIGWAQDEEDTETEAEICRILGQADRVRDRYPEAEGWLERSVAVFRQFGDSRRTAIALNQLGRVHQLQYRYADALACASEALTHLAHDDPERAESHYVLGMVALFQRRWADAEEQQKLALAFRLRGEDERTIAWAYQNLGFVYLRQTEYGGASRLQEAEQLLGQAVDQLENLSDPYHLALAQTNLGTVYSQLGEYQKSIRLFQLASTALRALGAQRPLAQAYNNLGLLYLHLAEPERAESVFRDGVAIYLDIDDHQSRLNTQHGVVLALLAQQRFGEAAALCEESLDEIERLQNYPEEYEEKRGWYTASLQKARQGISG